jgi:hypothetical protein
MDIDLVITWVNGSDPAWQAVRNSCNPPAESEGRYRELGLLPYWFRAASSYAPWARRIHFVTWGHAPPFMNRKHPRLRIVRHEDFIPAEYLPTFNSHTIECHLHRIPGLSEHFIYFNDDMFLLRPALPEDFSGRACPAPAAGRHPGSSGERWVPGAMRRQMTWASSTAISPNGRRWRPTGGNFAGAGGRTASEPGLCSCFFRMILRVL